MASSANSKTMNPGGADPVQGFDVGVFFADASTNTRVLKGQFTSIVVTVRNATEAYIEMGTRYPRYLDGEYQIAVVCEKGLLDIDVFQETFGFKRMGRTKRMGRSPRFDITFSVNPVDADILTGSIPALDGSFNRSLSGRFILENVKIDSWHFASTSGRQVVATQWQGVAEGIIAIKDASDSSAFAAGDSPGLLDNAVDPGVGLTASSASYTSIPDGVATTTTTSQGFGVLGSS